MIRGAFTAAPQPPWTRRWSPGGVRTRPIWMGAIVVFLALVVLGVTSVGLTILLFAAVLLAGLVLLTWHHPHGGLYALVALGSVHQTAMLLVFFATRSGTVVKAAQSWKDVVLMVLLFKVVDLAFRRGRAPRLSLLDLGIAIFLAIGIFYLFYPSQVEEATFLATLFGLRADALFFVAYFIGRGMPLTIGLVRGLMVTLLAVGMVIAAVAAVQVALPGATNDIFNALGFQQFIGIQQVASNVFALRENQLLGGLRIPRASSLLLSDLALSFHSLLLAPIALALLLTLRGLGKRLLLDLVAVATTATGVLTVTRSAILAMGPVLAVVAIRGGGLLLTGLATVQLALGGLLVAASFGLTARVIEYMFSTSESSAQGHFTAIEISLAVLRQQPFGRGLGTAGQVAQRLVSQQGITNESWYLQIATEIGVIPAALFLLLIIGFGVVAWLQAGRVRDPWLKALCLGMLGATVGFAIVGVTLHVWEALTTSIIFWLFAGIVGRADQIQAEADRTILATGDAARRLA